MISQWVAETASALVSALATTGSVRARSVLAQQTSLDLGHGRVPLNVLGSGCVVHRTVVVGMVAVRQSPAWTI